MATRPPTKTTVVVARVMDEAFLAEQVERVSIPKPEGSFMVAVVAANEKMV